MKFKSGTKFTVCSPAELIKRGWIKHASKGFTNGFFRHEDFKGCSITMRMIDTHEDDTLTVKEESKFTENWYWVKENTWEWPVATFLNAGVVTSTPDHICVEGTTPIDGWVICKICGNDLWLCR